MNLEDLPVDRRAVRWAYRLLLGREPEDDGSLDAHLPAGSVARLREIFLQSDEFRTRWDQAEEARREALRDRSIPERLGLEGYVREADFLATYERFFAPLLDRRAAGFRALFERLRQREQPALIVETGTLRVAGNWAGDGQSTFLFDEYLNHHGGTGFSVDILPEAVAAAREVCSPRTSVILADSVAFLDGLATAMGPAANGGRAIDLLYLDSMDVDFARPEVSARHHLRELEAAWPLLGSGSLVAVDDNLAPVEGGAEGAERSTGKGRDVETRLREAGLEPLYDGYQKVWQLP